MEIQGILKNLREKNNLTQEQLAERVQVTRQAVSRWETGETQPNTDTLKLLSRVLMCQSIRFWVLHGNLFVSVAECH